MATLTEKQEHTLEILKSKMQIRALFKDVHIEDIEKMLKRITDVTVEIRTAYDAEIEEKKKKSDFIQSMVGDMIAKAKEQGIELSPDDCMQVINPTVAATVKTKATRKPAQPSGDKTFIFLYKNEKGDVVATNERTKRGNFGKAFDAYMKLQDITDKEELAFSAEEVNKALELNKMPFEWDEDEEGSVVGDLEAQIEISDEPEENFNK